LRNILRSARTFAVSGKPVNVTTGADDNHDGNLQTTAHFAAAFARNTMHGPAGSSRFSMVEHDFLLVKGKKEGPELTVGLNSF